MTQAVQAAVLLRMIRTGVVADTTMSSGEVFHALGNVIDEAEDESDGSLTTHQIFQLKRVLHAFRVANEAAVDVSLIVGAILDGLPR